MREGSKILIIAFIAALLLIVQSCSGVVYAPIPRNEKRGFDFCYDGKDTGLDSLIRIDGYYEIRTVKYDNYVDTTLNGYPYKKPVDTLIAHKDSTLIAFFNDGMTASSWLGYEYLLKKQNNGELDQSKLQDYFTSWGNYKVQGDSIITHTINRPSLLSANWFGREEVYVIKDSRTLEFLSRESFNPRYKKHLIGFDSLMNYSNATFRSTDFLPVTDVWLKKKKWFKCEEK